jgi:VIT1/CCC1 family predicted Fe2+/Mn2+ transporter
MRVGLARRHLSYTDRAGETAFAVIMVMIINGFIALSKLNTGFLCIVFVNLGACASWGFIDGFIYSTSESIERNNNRKKLLLLKSLKPEGKDQLAKVKDALQDTFLANFDDMGKEAIARDIVANAPNASLEESRVINKEEMLGWLSIMLIYLITGFVLALPFLVLPNKMNAWAFSNLAGSAWLFWYGVQLGNSVGKHRLLLGVLLAMVGIAFLLISYFVWTGR